MKTKVNLLNLLIIFSFALLFVSCVTMKAPNMVVHHPKMVFPSEDKVVKVDVSSETLLPIVFEVEEYEAALKQSIIKSQLYDVSSKNFDYLIRAKIVDFYTTPIGFNMDTDIKIEYDLISPEIDDTIYTDTIKTSYTAPAGDAFVGLKRSLMSIEGASKENIREYILNLSLSLNAQPQKIKWTYTYPNKLDYHSAILTTFDNRTFKTGTLSILPEINSIKYHLNDEYNTIDLESLNFIKAQEGNHAFLYGLGGLSIGLLLSTGYFVTYMTSRPWYEWDQSEINKGVALCIGIPLAITIPLGIKKKKYKKIFEDGVFLN